MPRTARWLENLRVHAPFHKKEAMSEGPYFSENERIVLRADGLWIADGQEITHGETCRAFFRFLQRDSDGYFLQIGRETKRIEVEDCAFFITRIEGTPQDGYALMLSDGTQVSLDPANLRYRPGRLTSRIMTRLGEAEARFLRGPYFELLSHLEENEQGYYLNFGGTQVILARK